MSTNKLRFKHCHESSSAFMATEWNGRGVKVVGDGA